MSKILKIITALILLSLLAFVIRTVYLKVYGISVDEIVNNAVNQVEQVVEDALKKADRAVEKSLKQTESAADKTIQQVEKDIKEQLNK